ncbi:MAG TPA: VCBS repeat-containing protein [Planctomycetes bacterium]|nr:VCBS repeat-containing protein [Planctomycetota bacterium]
MTKPGYVISFLLIAALITAWYGVASYVQPAPIDLMGDPVATSPVTEQILSIGERQYVWDLEHLAFILEQKCFPGIKQAWANPAGGELLSYLADDFQATVPALEWTDDYTDRSVLCRDLAISVDTARTTDHVGLLDLLSELQSGFRDDDTPDISIGLVRLGPKKRMQFDGPWESRWRIRRAGIGANGPLEINMDVRADLKFVTADLADHTGWIQHLAIERVRTTECRQPLMIEITDTCGINSDRMRDNWRVTDGSFVPNTGGVYLSDYDSDGTTDLLVDDIDAGVRLYRGTGAGSFEDVTAAVGLPLLPAGESMAWALSCWCDLDGDGDDDLIVEDRLYENDQGRFRDVSERTNLLLTPANGYAVADYDLDGRLDLYVCHGGVYRAGQERLRNVRWIDGGTGIDNILWRNRGDWQFEDVTASTNTGGDGSSCFAAVWFDANGDRRPDLFAINEFGRNSLMTNTAEGPFTSTTIDPLFGGFSMGVTAGDFDNDGNTDVFVANMYSKAGNRILANIQSADYPTHLFEQIREATTGNKMYRGVGNGRFEVMPGEDIVADVGWAYGPGMFDLDGNGFLDLCAPAGFKSTTRGKPDG